MAKKAVKVGDKIPDFLLKDNRGKEVRLSELKDKRVLLSFHPQAWTSVCAEQMKSLKANLDSFKKLNAIALGLSIDTVPSKNAWAKSLGIKEIKLLSDFWPHGGFANQLGMFRDNDGFSERANVILNENQKAVFVKIYDIPQLPDIKEIIDFLKSLK